jgi:hypothetical protein
MGLLDQVKNKVREAREEGRLKETDPYHPKAGWNRWWVYTLIMNGYKPSKGAPKLVGATDAEIADVLPGEKASTLRWCRWSLEKNGWIERSGKKRSIGPGQPELEIWVITDKELDSFNPPKYAIKERVGHADAVPKSELAKMKRPPE